VAKEPLQEVLPHTVTRCAITGEVMAWCSLHIKWEHLPDHEPCPMHDVEGQ
jgi:hypothetical protein